MKSQVRKALRRSRRALGADERARFAHLAARAVTRLPQFKAGARVAVYLPFDGEMDTAKVLTAARRRGVRIFVPVVADRRHRRIEFHPLAGATRRGTFGILIPDGRGRPTPARWLDLVLVPLVGVDSFGRRLGFGGGFYDRALAFRRNRRAWPGPRLVGFCFDCQRVDTVHAESWDARLDALATESGITLFTREPPPRRQEE